MGVEMALLWLLPGRAEALVDYMRRSGDRSFVPTLLTTRKRRPWEVIELLGVGSYDDMQWWSLAYRAIAYRPSSLVS